MKVDSFLGYGSTFRVLLFAAGVVIFGFYMVKDTTASKVLYFFFGMGLMGFYHEFRQWRVNRMPEADQISHKVSAAENKLD